MNKIQEMNKLQELEIKLKEAQQQIVTFEEKKFYNIGPRPQWWCISDKEKKSFIRLVHGR